MPNNPHLHYRSDIFINAPIAVTLDAADWAVFMAWISNLESLSGASYIVYQISQQVLHALYTPQSIKAANAEFDDQQEKEKQAHTIKVAFPFPQGVPFTPPDFNADNACEVCGRIPNPFSAPCPDCKDWQP